jgi:hypothetical protein
VTAYITGLKNPVVEAVVKGLTNQRGAAGFNFEYVLYALEELDSYFLRKRYPAGSDVFGGVRSDVFGGVLSAFTEISPEFEIFQHESLLMHRFTFVKELAALFWSRTKTSSPALLTKFFERLRSRFDLSVFTLNYDNLVDQTGAWFDGFSILGSGAKAHWSFDRRRFREDFSKAPQALAHLHGSLQFGFATGTDIVKFERPDDAVASLANWPMNASAPLISGFKKVAKLVRDPTPFGYYYGAFIDAVLDTPRFLMAGYSGNDPHVTTWLLEFSRIHGSASRTVTIDVAAPYAPTPKDRHESISTTAVTIDVPAPYAPTGPSLLALIGGFPPSDSDLDRVIEHLDGI